MVLQLSGSWQGFRSPVQGVVSVFLTLIVIDFRQSTCRTGPLRFSLSEAVVSVIGYSCAET